MKKVLITALCSLTVTSCASTSDSSTPSITSGIDYSQLSQTALMAAVDMWAQQNESSSLADTLAKETSVTGDQALGGVGSLLALAQNSLSTSDSQELSSLIPGASTLESSGLTSLLQSKGAVESAFSSLGMDPSLVTTFAPIILQVLQTQGASSSLLSSLGSIWQ
ncbi:DUF2780 domain-containing protein [Vibrio gallaecicus]|uniref:DUF2780 domain-containing protein n=1 Tax=Vibrio gallaecicus TaxID=552386 RepID=UPI0010C99EAE|nr:DUF2780 domain-containing protein [Vibrio gallaecicus]MDN3615308.1 DUF2780 domain-containing protein [Vibrio gallaecicus]